MDKDLQNKKVEEMYSEIAGVYDSDFEGKADYQVPSILKKIFKKHEIENGLILDIGCGTGKLSKYLGNDFSYEGVDLSEAMLRIAKDRGYKIHHGDMLEILKSLDNDSVDHVVALSSLYFIDDFKTFVEEAERVARKSLFVTLEQFTDYVKDLMQKKGITIVNHPADLIDNPTEEIKNTHLWTRPNTDDKIFGDIVFKLLN